MKASGKIGSNGVWVSDNVERRFETDIRVYIHTVECTKFYRHDSVHLQAVMRRHLINFTCDV